MQSSTRKEFEVKVERIIPGGKGLGFHDNKAVFVPLAVPQDRIRVRRYRDKRSYLEVLESEIVHPSANRIAAPCPYFGICGGCDFQQMRYDAQIEAKRDILLDALRRIGKVEVSSSQVRLHSSPEFGYRNRIRVRPVWWKGELSWSFFHESSHQAQIIDSCLIADPSLWRKLEDVKRLLMSISGLPSSLAETEVFLGDEGDSLVELILESSVQDVYLWAEKIRKSDMLQDLPRLQLAISSSSTPHRVVLGTTPVFKSVGGFKYRVSHGSFFQVNGPMLPLLCEIATQSHEGERALEFFCGIGFFTLPLAAKFGQLQAIEGSDSAATDLRENLRSNQVSNVSIFNGDVRSYLEFARAGLLEHDLVLLDPPRSGVPKEALESIADLRAKRMVYISCDPSTLARDLRVMATRNYEIETIDLVDLFPQTHHLETVVHLKRH